MTAILCAAAWAQQGVFYALGTTDAEQGVRVYGVDGSLHALGSVEVAEAESGMLTGTHDSIILGTADSRAWRVSVPDLKIISSFTLGPAPGRIHCLQHAFVHPLTGLAYFSCDFGSGGNGILIVDMVHQIVVADLPSGPTLPPGWPRGISLIRPIFTFDAKTSRLYLVGPDVVALNPQNQPVDYIIASQLAKAAGLDARFRYRTKLAVLPNGQLVLWLFSRVPHLILYDPSDHKVLRAWTETETYANRDIKALSPGQPSRQDTLWFGLPVPSRDGSRLIAESAGGNYSGLILFDTSTLQVLRRWIAPEPPGEVGIAPAPDGHGMWYFGQSGKIYRLDDHTGELLGEVNLPFHLISLIREP